MLALRGGTALNKLFIQPACRYSEDIDLVQTQAGPIGEILDAIRPRLDPWLGRPTRARAEGGVTLTYRFQSEMAPVRPLRLKIEINTREHFAVLDWHPPGWRRDVRGLSSGTSSRKMPPPLDTALNRVYSISIEYEYGRFGAAFCRERVRNVKQTPVSGV